MYYYKKKFNVIVKFNILDYAITITITTNGK